MINNPQEYSNIDDLISQIKQEKIKQKTPPVAYSNSADNATDDLLNQFKYDVKKQKEQEKNHAP